MNPSRQLLAAAAALMAMGGTALAADVVILPPPAPPAPMPVAAPAFVGPYWGTYGGIAQVPLIQATGVLPVYGTQFGYNFGTGNARFGFEIETEYLRTGLPVISGALSGRAGLVFNNRLLAYGQIGIGTTFTIPTLSFGGGVELMLNSGLVVFAEAKALRILGGGGPLGWTFRGGINYYAGTDNLDIAGNFDWGGLYMGVHANYTSPTTPPFSGGVQVGYNFSNDRFLWGVEVEASHILTPGFPVVNASLNGRVGFLMGRLLAYGEAGIGTYATTAIMTLGGGVELPLGDELSLFAEGAALFIPGGGGLAGYQISGGLNVHFGR